MPATTEASPPPPKLSRYRTIRGRNVPESRRYVEPVQKRVAGDDRTSHAGAPPPNPALPPAASKASNQRCLWPPEAPGNCLVQSATPISPRALVGPSDLALEASSATTVPLRSDGSLDSGFYATHVASAAGIMSDEEVAQRDADAEILLAEQKRKDLERLQLQLENHQPVALPPRSTARDKFSFLSRRRGQQTGAKDDLLITAFSKASTSSPSKQSKPTPAYSDNTVTISQTQTSAEQRAGYQNDASSAPDSGTAKEVLVYFRHVSSKIAVHSDTTVADVLHSCPGLLPYDNDTDTSALVENYARLGLQRRLRRYERIRDIMNTWDRDTDNTLAVVVSAVGSTDSVVAGQGRDGSVTARKHDTGDFGAAMNGDLELSSVSQEQSISPPGVAFTPMYHSQKPGRWSKRFISLVGETGQVLSSKKFDAGRLASLSASEYGVSSSNDFQSLCHLSDYDIYCPTEAEMRKRIKPPKKFCFAVKSQQRTTVFLNTENYVHFFCLDDPVLAREFYGHVFAWRSWYLVNRKLSLASPTLPMVAKNQQQRQLIRTDQSPSCDTSKIYPTARRLPDMGLRAKGDENNSSTRRMFNGNEFAVGSLLGSTYDDRKNLETAKQSEANGLAPDVRISRMGPFTDGSLLDNDRSVSVAPSAAILTPASAAVATSRQNGRHEPSSWIPSATENSARDHDHQPSRRPIAVSRPSSSSSTSQQQSLYLPAVSGVVKTPPASIYRGRQQYGDRDISKERQQSMRRTASHTSYFRHEQQRPRMPAPLIDLTPKFQEAPQWSKDHRGHGVRAPPGTTHLVDLATRPNGGSDSTLEPIFSGATLLRRDATDSKPPARYRKARAQTMTSASAAAAASFTRSHHTVHHSSRTRDHPPVPLLSRIPPHSPSAHDAANASHEPATTTTLY